MRTLIARALPGDAGAFVTTSTQPTGDQVWRQVGFVVVVLYVLCSALLVVIAGIFSTDPPEFQPPGGWWPHVEARIVASGAGLLGIFVAVRALRRSRVHPAAARQPTAMTSGRTGLAVAVIAVGWLGVLFGVGLPVWDVGSWRLEPEFVMRLAGPGFVGLWMFVGLLTPAPGGDSGQAT